MNVQGRAFLDGMDGDPNRYCEQVTITADDWKEKPILALLHRVFNDDKFRDQAVRALKEIEEELSNAG